MTDQVTGTSAHLSARAPAGDTLHMSKKAERKKLLSGKKKLRPTGPLVIDLNQDCHLLCFGEQAAADAVQSSVLNSLLKARMQQRVGPPWLVFCGDSPHHWAGLTLWVLVSANVPPAVFDQLCGELRNFKLLGKFESTEMTTPARERFVEPLLSVGDHLPELLVPEGGPERLWGRLLTDLELPKRSWRPK